MFGAGDVNLIGGCVGSRGSGVGGGGVPDTIGIGGCENGV